MKRRTALFIALFLTVTLASCATPHMATGFKIGEVTDSEAIVWVRLTENEKRVDYGAPLPEISYTLASTGEPLTEMQLRPSEYIRRQVRVAAFSYEGPARLMSQCGDLLMMSIKQFF